MIEALLLGKVSRIAVLVAALLCPFAILGCSVETLKLHGIAFPAPNFWPFHGSIELVHGAIADRDAAVRARDLAMRDMGLALHDRDVARGNQGRLQAGLDVCNASVTGLQKAAQDWQDRASAAVASAEARRRALDRARAAVAGIRSSNEMCPVADQILRAALQ